MIDVHYWPTPNGKKITILLEELGTPYKIVPCNIGKGDQFTDEFLRINPNNRMPALVDHEPAGGEAPISIFESGAIMLYIAEKTGQFVPTDLAGRYEVVQWVMWQMANQGPKSGEAGHFRRLGDSQGDQSYAVRRFTDEVNRLYGVMNTRLAKREFLAGRYSIADIACVGWVRLAERQGQDLAQFPHLLRWFETIRARPAVKRAFAIRVEAASKVDVNDPKVRAVLFSQRAR